MKETHSFGESVEMYLKTIAELDIGEGPVPVTGVAERLNISTVSASEMIHRLQDQDLLEHTPYKGVHLTARGRRRANGVIRRHRLWEIFLTEVLGLPWDRSHEYACRLEHATDEEVTEALADYLGQPTTCPHGNPIPTEEGEMPLAEGVPLSELSIDQGGVLSRVQDVNSLLLAHLQERDIKPGMSIRILEIAPFNGPLTVEIGDEQHVLGRQVASHLIVKLQEMTV